MMSFGRPVLAWGSVIEKTNICRFWVFPIYQSRSATSPQFTRKKVKFCGCCSAAILCGAFPQITSVGKNRNHCSLHSVSMTRSHHAARMLGITAVENVARTLMLLRRIGTAPQHHSNSATQPKTRVPKGSSARVNQPCGA